jgi:hypothetical protein
MGINFTADSQETDITFGGGVNATNWSKTFADYRRSTSQGAYYHMSGQTGFTSTLDMPFYYSITVLPRTDPGTGNYDSDGGNRYYPVSFATGSVRRASSRPNLVIARSYSQSGAHQFETANSVDIGWTGSSSHQGGLYASYIVGDSAWSDMYEGQVTRVRQTYHTTIADHGMQLAHDNDRGSGPFWVMLRGGFTYYIYASYPAMPTQVTAGGSCFSYSGNDQFRTWPASTTTLVTKSGITGDDGLGNGFTYGNNLTGMG